MTKQEKLVWSKAFRTSMDNRLILVQHDLITVGFDEFNLARFGLHLEETREAVVREKKELVLLEVILKKWEEEFGKNK